MKYLGVLKALPSCQVYSRHLSIYVKIGLSERGSLQYALCGTDEEQQAVLIVGKVVALPLMFSAMENGETATSQYYKRVIGIKIHSFEYD